MLRMRHVLLPLFVLTICLLVCIVAGCAVDDAKGGATGGGGGARAPGWLRWGDEVRKVGEAATVAGGALAPVAPQIGGLIALGGLILTATVDYVRKWRENRALKKPRVEWNEYERQKYRQTGQPPPGKPPRPRTIKSPPATLPSPGKPAEPQGATLRIPVQPVNSAKAA